MSMSKIRSKARQGLTVLQKCAGTLRRAGIDPEKEAVRNADKISRGKRVGRILESDDWAKGLKPLLDEISADFARILQKGYETDLAMDKARGAMDAIEKIYLKMNEAVHIGRQIEEKLKNEE